MLIVSWQLSWLCSFVLARVLLFVSTTSDAQNPLRQPSKADEKGKGKALIDHKPLFSLANIKALSETEVSLR